MKENATPRIRFCDEYEALIEEFIKVLAVWSQLRVFEGTAESAETLADVEVARADRRYSAALWALRLHSRECVLCEETLRDHVNGGGAPAATFGAS
jgi:hypothetical protein